jgi:hypothetical protein
MVPLMNKQRYIIRTARVRICVQSVCKEGLVVFRSLVHPLIIRPNTVLKLTAKAWVQSTWRATVGWLGKTQREPSSLGALR